MSSWQNCQTLGIELADRPSIRASADMPVIKEPSGLARADGKRPDGLSLIPWRAGRPPCWDVTVVCATASSYLQTANVSAAAVAEMTAIRKTSKFQELAAQYTFQPIAVKSLGSMDTDTRDFLVDLGRRINTDRFLFCFCIFLFFFISVRFCYLIALSWTTNWSFNLNSVCFLA